MSNVCNCPQPPGGSVTCGDSQLAVCGYRNGEIVSGCFDPPGHAGLIQDDSERNLVLANWIVATITETWRGDYDPIEPDLFKMLRSGRYKDETTGAVVKFTLPRDLDLQSAARARPGVAAG